MNRFKKSKYVIIIFVTVLLVSALLATTYSSTIVTKLGDGISLVDRVVQKPFQWFDWECVKSRGQLYYGQPSDKYGKC